MLEIKNLKVSVDDQEILHGINLTVQEGEVHAIMGPNGSGKSTLANVLAGKENYKITDGTITYFGKSLSDMSIEERAHHGLFVAFQYPIAIPGVSNINFLKSAFNANQKARGKSAVDAVDFLTLVRKTLDVVQMDEDFLYRAINDGFSGGEKKRNEILQMALLEPRLAILDETDSGLDIDALRIISAGVNQLASPENATLLITHYQRLLDLIIPDYVHVMAAGQILRSGGKELALELEKSGYDWVDKESTAEVLG